MKSKAIALAVACFAAAQLLLAQSAPPPTVTVRSNLVLVPVLVTNKSGGIVFSLRAEDFTLTDDGVLQTVRLESNTDSEPLALAVIVQTGGRGASHLGDYRHLDAMLDSVIGNVPHRVAVIGFGSTPQVELPFTSDTGAAAKKLANLRAAPPGAAILDALRFGMDLLREQPPAYRRAVLLFSETVDSGSQTSLEDAVRAIDDTNTTIYSFAFSTTKATAKHQVSQINSQDPYPAGGCMSRDADPDAHGDRRVQALDCASDLLPPLRLARAALLTARDGLKRNVPETVARLTGGEYFPFKNASTLAGRLVAVSNDVPNYYVLSFRPQIPHQVKMKNSPNLRLRARKAYWVDGESAAASDN